MQKLITLLLFVVLLTPNSYSQTQISGQIRTNTTWTKAGSPYICSGLIEIAPNVTLTIDSGTTVILKGDMDVYGRIKFNSTKSAPINFTSNDTANIFSSQGYRLVKFKDSNSTDTLTFNYCNVNSITLNLQSKKNTTSTIIVSNSLFKSTVLTWLAIEDGYVEYSNNNIVHSRIILDGTDNHINKYIFNGNTVKHGAYNSMSGWVKAKNLCEIKNNTFSKSVKSITMHVVDATLEIENNIFLENDYGIYQLNSTINKEYAIHNNIFINNKHAIFISPYITSKLSIRNNTIYDNDTGIILGTGFGTQTKDINIDHNCIYDNRVYNLVSLTKFDYNVDSNWWGTTDSAAIDSLLFDYYDDFKYGKLEYKNFLKQKTSNCKTYTPPTGLNSLKESNSVNVFPNPFTNSLKIQSNSSIQDVYLYNFVGKQVLQHHTGKKEISLSTQTLPAGVYFYRIISTENKITTGKLIKQ